MTNFIRKSISDKGDASVRRQAKASSVEPNQRQARGLGRHGIAFLVLLLACAGIGAPAAGAAVPAKGVTGYFGATGAAGGQLNTPRGTAVNQTNGNVYTADSNNNRIAVFNSSGTFLRAFGQDVVASGPGDKGIEYEICVAANGDVCKAGITTASTGGAMQTPQGLALDAAGNVYVSESTKLRVQKFDASGNFLLAFGQDVVESGPGNAPATSAVQTLTVTATEGKYKLKFGGKETAELAYNSSAAAIQTALTGLTSIGTGNATVSETSAGVFKITFAGGLANNPEPVIGTESGPGEPLVGGTATVVNTTTGATGFEVCVAAVDICKTGVTGDTAGAFKSAFTGQLDVAPSGAPNAGNVLVADPANLRVQEFTSAGAFVRAFGFDVVRAGPGNAGTGFEVCNASAGDACKTGVTGTGNGQFSNSVNRVAEDADGNIYTVESGTPNFRVQKFTLPGNVVTPQGNFAQAITKGTAATSAPFDVAIDPQTKNVLVTKAFLAGATPTCPNTGVASVAERRVLELSQAGVLEGTHMVCAGINVANGLAMRSSASTGDIYVSSTTGESRLYVLNVQTPPTVGFSGVSNITAHSATVSGFVNPNPTGIPYALNTGYRIAYKRSVDSTFSSWPGEEVNLGRSSSNLVVSQNLEGLEANTTYEVQIVATKAGFNGGSAATSIFTFTTPAAKPVVSIPTAVTASTGSDARAVLSGLVNPRSQATTYRFEYGTSSSYGSSVPVPDGSVGSGATAVPVSQSLTGLQPSTTYHFRLVATNPQGTVTSPDQTFTTPLVPGSPGACPNEQLRQENNSMALPNCRAYELVTPADKKPQGIIKTQFPGGSLSFQTAEDGQSLIFPLLGGLEDSTHSGDTSYRAVRTDSGWQSTQVTPPSLVTAPTVSVLGGATPGMLVYNSPNLSCSVILTFNPLTEDVPLASREYELYNYYVRDNTTGTYRLVTNTFPANPGIEPKGGGGLNPFTILGAADDCSRVYFATKYEFLPDPSGLYEWDDGTLRDAGRLPNGTRPPGPPAVGGEAIEEQFQLRHEQLNPVSADGERFFFTAPTEPGGFAPSQVYARLDGSTVVEVSRKQGGAQNSLGARYETASPDGSHVFFLGNYGLTAQSSVGAVENCSFAGLGAIRNCDLYDYDVETGGLTNLSADPNPADPRGAVAQGVLAVSDDGSSVYFAARGQLIPGQGKTFAENISGAGSVNIYLTRNGQLSYVTSVSASTFTEGDLRENLTAGQGRARATPGGDHLLFSSTTNITGYNSGGKLESFRFSADTRSIHCISCRLDGLLPDSYDLASGFTIPLNAGLMADDGQRIFFARPDALAPGAADGMYNIYEWDRGQVHLLASEPGDPGSLGPAKGMRLVGASASGNEVFFSSSSSLIPNDTDFAKDAYVARVNGGFPVPPPSVSCDPAADQCQGSPAGQPGAPSPASAGFTGPGNPSSSPAKAKCPKGKVRKRGKCVKKHSSRKRHKKHSAKRHDRPNYANHGGAK